MSDFIRPRDSFRYSFGGLKTNVAPNSVPPGKYLLAQNIRAYDQDSIVTRPGQSLLFSGGGSAYFTDVRAYTQLITDSKPRYLAVDVAATVWVDSGTSVGSLATGGFNSPGVSMIPFRPNASPTPWMYIGNLDDYQKFSAPTGISGTCGVVQQKVGIAEPQTPPDAGVSDYFGVEFFTAGSVPTVAAGGTAAAATNSNRINDTTSGTSVADPVVANLKSIVVGTTVSYSKWMLVQINSGMYIVRDVFPPLPTSLTVQAIYYFSGTTGHCVIVAGNVGQGPGAVSESLYAGSLLATLRRGALIKIGTETVYVWSVTEGPGGSVSIETSTTSTHTTADTIGGVPAISVFSATGFVYTSITCRDLLWQVTTGIGTQTGTFGPDPFDFNGDVLQAEDYIHFSIQIDNLANLNEIKFLLDVGDGSFTQNFYYYTVRPSDIAAAVANTLTQIAAAQIVSQRAVIDEEQAAAANNQGTTASSAQTPPGSSQWAEILFPISALTRVGNDQTKTLHNANKWQILVNASGTVNVAFNGYYHYGGFSPDVGDVGAPYRYRVRPRSQLTGAIGNPSPETRYGVTLRREQGTVYLPSAAYDSQIDTWDIFRYGGSVTEWRFIGSTPSTNTTFDDIYDDAAAGAGDLLDFDNFEPWPTVDVPNNGTASTVCGTLAVVSTTDTDIVRYLPGTLVRLGGQNVYTLWARPISLGLNNYLLQFVENAGAGSSVPYNIQEPILAQQPNAYLWGPDANGTVFACGDEYRPGTVSFCKNYAPDQVPDSYNIEVSQPSEPLLGGIIVDGLSYVGSSMRWWAMYPQPGGSPTRYNLVQLPVTRGIAAPFGICTDGKSIYWWAKDGIYSSTKGSLTDADLYNLFPHEGVAGETVTYAGQTIKPPDYSQSPRFRLSYVNGFLYATYWDASQIPHTLVLDTKTGAWSLDDYTPAVTSVYQPEQPASGQANLSNTLYDELVMTTVVRTGGTPKAAVVRQAVATNDLDAAISCNVASFEFDGGDLRAVKQWGDVFLDVIPAARGLGPNMSLVSTGAVFYGPSQLANGTTRTRIPRNIGSVYVEDFCGLLMFWQDDFTLQTIPTRLFAWQPSFVVQPASIQGTYTFGTTFGLKGYSHIYEIILAYVSTQPVTLAITTYDGQSPASITLPSTGSAYRKTTFRITANKGMLFKFAFSSTAPFQIFEDDCEIMVGEWGRSGVYSTQKSLGNTPEMSGVV